MITCALFVVVLVRASATYALGRAIAAGTRRTRLSRLTASRGYRNAVRLLNRWGAPAVTVSFLTVGLQTMVNLGAGCLRMPLRRYVPALLVGCALWAGVYATIGFVSIGALAALWDRSPVAAVLVGLVLLALFALFVWRQARRTDDASEDPAAA